MVSRTLLVVLVAACSVQSLNAWPWPWDRKTTTTTTTTTTTPKPAVMSREKFLGLLSQASQNVTGEVAKSHQLVQEADAADTEGQAITKAIADVSAYTKQFTDKLNDYATRVIKNTVDTAPCVDRFMDDKAEIEAYSVVNVKNYIHSDMQDVRNTPTKSDGLLEQIAAVKARGEAEAAKPDDEYGGDVEAILADADDIVSTAMLYNAHISALVYDFKFSAEISIDDSDAPMDIMDAVSYGRLCMRRVHRSLSQQ